MYMQDYCKIYRIFSIKRFVSTSVEGVLKLDGHLIETCVCW